MLGVVAGLACACATAPKPTATNRRIRANPPGIVEGRVLDASGKPVAGIGVRGIPQGADIPWSAPAVTACDGSFRLSLAAPGTYAFLLLWNGVAVVTPSPADPAHTHVVVNPGTRSEGVNLIFLDDEWRRITPSAPAGTPSCGGPAV